MNTGNASKVFVRQIGHANKHSLPLRFGHHFPSDDSLILTEVLSVEPARRQCKQTSALFHLPEKKDNKGTIIFKPWTDDKEEHSGELVTLWDQEKEPPEGVEALSSFIRAMEECNRITTQDLLSWHEEYLKVEKFGVDEFMVLLIENDKVSLSVREAVNKKREELDEHPNTEPSRPNFDARILKEVNLRVPYGRYGHPCTELVFEDDTKKYMKVSSFDKNGHITEKAQDYTDCLVLTGCWDPINEPGKWSSLGYFNDVYKL